MPAPLIGAAAAAAARIISKKLAQRAVGGIAGAAAKSVNPVYRNIGPSVKVVPGKTTPAPKANPKPNSGIENRGAKPSKAEQGNRARELQWNKAEKNYDSDTRVAGLRGGPNAKPQGAKGKNLRHQEAIKKEAQKRPPVKIKSN
jgi:hypothetical protein